MTPRSPLTMDPRKIISDEEIERVHANANFGSMSKRDVVNEGVWKAACEWHMGCTMETIIIEHGLAEWRADRHKPPRLTAKGRKYLFAALRDAKISWPTPRAPLTDERNEDEHKY